MDVTVNKMIQEFLYEMEYVSYKDTKTINQYKIALVEFNKYMFANEGKISDMQSLKARDILHKWLVPIQNGNDGRKPLGKSAINQRRSALSKFYKFLSAEGYDITNIVSDISKVTKNDNQISLDDFYNQKKKFLEMNEVENLLNEVEKDDKKLTAYENKRNEMMIKLFLGCGLRITELSLLTYRHINVDDSKIYITSDIAKQGKSRIVDVPDVVMDLYKEYLEIRKAHKNTSDFLFISRKNNQMHVNSIRDVVTKVSTNANGSKIKPHGLRHTYGTQQIAAGENPVYVQQQMGHANLAITTGIYVHQTKEKVNRANNNPMFNKKIG